MRAAQHLYRLAAATVALVALAGGVGAHAAPEEPWPPPGVSYNGDPKAPADFSGQWLGSQTFVPGRTPEPNRGPADGRPNTFWAPWPLPYNPAFKKIYDERQAALRRGVQLGDISATCKPFGVPMMLVAKVYPDEIIQTPGNVTFLFNSGAPMFIWTDGRGHPKDFVPTHNGHSIGYWIGDTLFVDTVGIVGSTPLEHLRNAHSEKLRIKWSIQRVAADTLHLHLTLYDEGAFTHPVTTTNIWERKTERRWEVLDDASCFENNKNLPGMGPATQPGFIKF